MSVCLTCGRPMDWAEAERYYDCRDCRKHSPLASHSIRRITDPGTETRGRRDLPLPPSPRAPEEDTP